MMPKSNDIDFNFNDNFSEASDNNFKNKSSRRKGIIKDFASGVIVGAAKQMGEYMPAVQESVESARDMSDTIRNQALVINQNLQKLKPYEKGIKTDVRLISKDIASTHNLKEKIHIAESGYNRIKKNIAYTMDADSASSFNFDFDDTETYGYDENGKRKKEGVTADTVVSTKINSEGFSTVNNSINNLNRSVGGLAETVYNGSQLETEAITDTAASMQSNANSLYEKANLILIQQHIEKMKVLTQIANNTAISNEFYAKTLGPITKQNNQYFEKISAQLKDVLSELKGSSSISTKSSPFSESYSKVRNNSKKGIIDFTTSNGGIDFSKLYNQATTNFKEGPGFMFDMLGDMKDLIPMMLMSGGENASFAKSLGKLVGKYGSKPFKKTATNLGNKLSYAIPQFMSNTNYEAKNGKYGGLVEQLAELLNIDTGSKSTIKLASENKRVPFDLVTRKSIVEVMPGYLSKILSAISGEPEQAFDFETGRFTTTKVLHSRMQNKINNAGFSDVTYSKDKLLKTSGYENDKQMKEAFDVILRNAMISNVPFNSKHIADFKNDATKGLKGKNGEKAWQEFNKAYAKLSSEDRAKLNVDVLKSKTSRRNELNDYEIYAQEYGLSNYYGNDTIQAQIDELSREKKDIKKIVGELSPEELEKIRKNNKNIDLKHFKLSNLNKVNLKGSGYIDKVINSNKDIDTQIAQLKEIQTSTGIDNNKIKGALSNNPNQKIYDLLLGGVIVYPRVVEDIPDHIKRLQKENNKTKYSSINQEIKNDKKFKKVQEEYAKAMEDSNNALHEQEDARNNKSNNGLFGRASDFIKNSGVLSKIPGSQKLASAFENINNSPIAKKYKDFTNKVNASINKASGYVDEYNSSGKLSESTKQKIKGDIYSIGKAAGLNIEKAGSVISSIGGEKAKTVYDKNINSLNNELHNKGFKGTANDIRKYIANKAMSGIKFTEDKFNIHTYNELKEKLGESAANKYKNACILNIKKNSKVAGYSIKSEFSAIKESLTGKKPKTSLNKEAATAINDIDKLINGDNKKKKKVSPEFTTNSKEKKEYESKPLENEEKRDAKGKLGILDRLNLWLSLSVEKVNAFMFGKKGSKTKFSKRGFIGFMYDKTKNIFDKIKNALLGNKKKIGFIQRLANPILKMIEQVRYSLTKNIILPSKSLLTAEKRKFQWKGREFLIGIKNRMKKNEDKRIKKQKSYYNAMIKKAERYASLGKTDKANAAYNKAKNGKARGGFLVGATRLASGFATGGITGALHVAGAPIRALNHTKAYRDMKNLWAKGRISKEEFEEWQNNYEESQDSEKKRHNEQMEKIKNAQARINMGDISNPDLKKDISGFNSRLTKLQNKESKNNWADIKEEQRKAKIAQKRNKRLISQGKSLTHEQEMEALTTSEKVYRERDDMVRKVTREAEKQDKEREKNKYEMEQKRTSFLENIQNFLLYGNTPKNKNKIIKNAKTAQNNINKKSKTPKEEPIVKEPIVNNFESENISNEIPKQHGKIYNMYNNIKDRGESIRSKFKPSNFLSNIKNKIFSIFPKRKNNKNIDKTTGYVEGSYNDQLSDALKSEPTKQTTQLKNVSNNTAYTVKKDPYGKKGVVTKIFKLLKGDKDKSLLSKLSNTTSFLASAIPTIVAAAAGKFSLINKGAETINRFKYGGIKEGLSYGLGLNRERDTSFNADGSEKSGISKAFDRINLPRELIMHTGVAAKFTKNTLGSFAKKTAKGAVKNSGFTKSAINLVKTTLTKFFKLKIIAKHVDSKKAIKIINKVTTQFEKKIVTIGKSFSKSAIGKTINGVLGVLSGGWGFLIFAASDFLNGFNNAGRYFNISNRDVTTGMRIAAGCTESLQGLLSNALALLPGAGGILASMVSSIIPTNWLTKEIYNLIANDSAENDLAEKQQKLQDRADALGIDSRKLSEAENTSIFDKAIGLVETKKYKENKLQKRLGLDNEQFSTYKNMKNNNASNFQVGINASQSNFTENMSSYQEGDVLKSSNFGNKKDKNPILPVNGPLTSPFGTRISPITGNPSFHGGIDIGAVSGTSVRAMNSGIVIKITTPDKPDPLYGGSIVIKHPDGFISLYAHLKRINVKLGQKIKKGQIIGLSGGAMNDIGRGESTGAHLHFTIEKNGKVLDPLTVLSQKGKITSDTPSADVNPNYIRIIGKSNLGSSKLKTESVFKSSSKIEPLNPTATAPESQEDMPNINLDNSNDIRNKIKNVNNKSNITNAMNFQVGTNSSGKKTTDIMTNKGNTGKIEENTNPVTEFYKQGSKSIDQALNNINFDPLIKHDEKMNDILHSDIGQIAQLFATFIKVYTNELNTNGDPLKNKQNINNLMGLQNALSKSGARTTSSSSSYNDIAFKNAVGGT